MIISKYDPLKKEQFQVLDSEGNIADSKLEPRIDDDTLINMYKTMKLARHADIKALTADSRS